MSFVSQVKGQFAEGLIISALEYAGYRVERYGVEHTVQEVKGTQARREGALQLPQRLWCAPDLLVIDPETLACTFLEVKFRGTFEAKDAAVLHAQLAQQVEHWPEMALAIVCPFPPGKQGSDLRGYVGCLGPNQLDRLVEDPGTYRGGDPRTHWSRLRTLGALFEKLALHPNVYSESKRLRAVFAAWRDV